jgi:hypothetical protein
VACLTSSGTLRLLQRYSTDSVKLEIQDFNSDTTVNTAPQLQRQMANGVQPLLLSQSNGTHKVLRQNFHTFNVTSGRRKPCFTAPFSFNAPCHYTLPILHPLIFGLTPCGRLLYIKLTPAYCIFLIKIFLFTPFLFMPHFS